MHAVDTFDYVVVGGGTAGLVVATRLSEDADVSVLILEGGEDRLSDSRVSIPGMAGMAQRAPDLAYRFQTVPQKYFNDRVVIEPQGKMLGVQVASTIKLSLRLMYWVLTPGGPG